MAVAVFGKTSIELFFSGWPVIGARGEKSSRRGRNFWIARTTAGQIRPRLF